VRRRPGAGTLSGNSGLFQLRRRQAQAISVAEEHDSRVFARGALEGFDPLACAHGFPHALDEAEGAVLGVTAVVTTHDLLDGLAGFVGVVEGDGADIVVQDVGLDDSVEQLAADKAKLTIDRGRGTASPKSPAGSDNESTNLPNQWFTQRYGAKYQTNRLAKP